MTITDQERLDAIDYCVKHLTNTWQTVDHELISVLPISGGMTNQLYCCSIDESITPEPHEWRQVLLRIYGPAKDCIDIDIEIFKQLASAGLGPRLTGASQGGRFEEYLPSNALK